MNPYFSNVSHSPLASDHFYVFQPREQGPAFAHRIPVSSFSPDADYVKDVLLAKPDNGVVELASAKSGIRLSFETNRAVFQYTFELLEALLTPYIRIRSTILF